MSEHSIPPDSWVGERVALRYWAGTDRNTITCGLEAVSDRGVVVAVDSDGGEKSRFYPWTAVLHIQPAGDESESAPRRQPFAVSVPRR